CNRFLYDPHGDTIILSRAQKRHCVLGKTGTTIAGSGIEETRSDPFVEAHSERQFTNIAANLFTEISQLIDEGDLGRQKRIGGIFDQFRSAALRYNDGSILRFKRCAVELHEDLAGALVLDADNDAVRLQEITDGNALAQKFGI